MFEIKAFSSGLQSRVLYSVTVTSCILYRVIKSYFKSSTKCTLRIAVFLQVMKDDSKKRQSV